MKPTGDVKLGAAGNLTGKKGSNYRISALFLLNKTILFFSISWSKFLNSSMKDRVLMAPQPTLAMKSTGDVELGAAGNLTEKKSSNYHISS